MVDLSFPHSLVLVLKREFPSVMEWWYIHNSTTLSPHCTFISRLPFRVQRSTTQTQEK